jgi:hypothetical protein
MNLKNVLKASRNCRLIFAAALSVSTAAFAGNTILNFSIDMTPQIGGGTFVPGTDHMEAHGTFNGWTTAVQLTNNPAAANSNIYSGSVVDTADDNGGKVQFKYVINGSNWENPATGNNRVKLLPTASGATVNLPTVFFSDSGDPVTTPVTFRVDMAQQINLGAFDPNTQSVDVRGMLNGWSTSELTNDPSIHTTNQFGLVTSNVYVGTYDVTASPGAAQAYKFYFNNGGDQWEGPSPVNSNDGGNRYFDNVAQTLPIFYFADQPYAPIVTANVKFQVDMSAQILTGAFDPSQDSLTVRGEFNSWSATTDVCTNDPGNTNLYSAIVQITAGVGANKQFKFGFLTASGNVWEQPAATTPQIGGNRYFTMPNSSNVVLAAVFFSDQAVNDYVTQPTEVTFTVNMTGAVGTDSQVFDPGTSAVYMNGDFLGWLSWSPFTLGPYQLTNNPVGSSNYSITLPIAAGTPLALTYKYSINGTDNEAPSGQNHYRLVRTLDNYNMPTDQFGTQFGEGSFGQLKANAAAGSTVPITWVGRPGVHLQTSTNLANPNAWVNLPETDGAHWTTGTLSNDGFVSQTNYPTAAGKAFFRLVKPGI